MRRGRPRRVWAVLGLLAVCGVAWALLRDRRASPPPSPAPPSFSSAPQSMVARLAALATEADPQRNTFRNAERAELLGAELARRAEPAQAVDLWLRYGEELLLAGRSIEAVRELEKIRRLSEQQPQYFKPGFRELMQDLLAVAYLRVGEQENCLKRHSPDACLVPIAGGGIHVAQRGSRAAIRTYRDILRERPDDLGARWLLNLAMMTVGEYPDGVPPALRIPPEVFASEAPMPRFPDVAPAVGVAQMGLSGGAIMEDFNGDGWLDLVASSWGVRDQLHYFENNGDGTFTDRTEAAGLLGQVGGLNICQADYDNDGDADMLVLRGAWLGTEGRQPNSLLRNRGDGTFEDVTEAAGVLSFHPTPTAAWGDYDNDGWLDLYLGNETGARTGYYTGKAADVAEAGAEPGAAACELYRNNGDGTFSEVAAEVGVANVGFVKGVAWGDYNNDGRLDLYLSRMGGPNVLYRNDGPTAGRWSFTDVTAEAGVAASSFTFPTWFWDYDNDGWLDLFVGGYAAGGPGDIAALYLKLPRNAEPSRIFRNKGDGTFEDVTAATGSGRAILVMGSNYGDLDNDGYLDWYAGNGAPNLGMLLPNRMFRNAEGRGFQDVTTAGGFGNIQKGHGVAFGDYDNDGDQDIYQVMGGAYSGDVYPNVLFQNPGTGHHWLTLRFEGVRSNRAGVGARVRVRVAPPEGPRDIYVTVGTGGSFGASSLQQEIGLGAADRIAVLEVDWPASGIRQRFTDLAVDQCLTIREDATAPIPHPLPQLRPAPASAPVRRAYDGR